MSVTNPIDIAENEISEENNSSKEAPTAVNVDLAISDTEATTIAR
jgi:hypothetical protein